MMNFIMNKILFTILLLILFTSGVFATAQEPDLLIYNGKTYSLFSNPLESFYEKDESKRPKFRVKPNVSSSANWRGYVATWRIIDNKLYLTEINSWFCSSSIKTKNGCRRVTLQELFGKKIVGNKVFASWVSDDLRVPDGEQLQYVHMGYGSIYERNITFGVKNGKVIKQEIIDNTKSNLSSEREVALQELEKLKRQEQPAKSTKNSKKSTNLNIKSILLTEKGFGKITIGAKRKVIESVLGQGEHDGRKYDDVYFVEYPQNGVQISYKNKTDEAYVIFLYNKQTYYGEFKTPQLTTYKGVNWNSTLEDIIKAYGNPPRDFKDETGRNAWRRLEYDKIDFLFEGGELTRISIANELCTSCKK